MARMVAFAESSRCQRRARTCKRAGSPSCNDERKPKTRFHRNQQYSITALTDGTGSIVERYAYNAYGQPTFLDGSGTVLTSSAEDNRYTYTGREWDEVLGLYHYRARMYDATEGRFVGRDPIRYRGSRWNLQEYVSGKPLHQNDSLGLQGHKVWKCCGGKSYKDSVRGEGEYGCCDDKLYRHSEHCCINGELISTSEQETITLTFRRANLPLGATMDDCFGKRHCSAKTLCCETGQGKVGAGVPGQGTEGFAFTICTEMVDHSGQSEEEGVINVQVKVNRCCFVKRIKNKTKQGPWIPLINDCNTVMQDAVEDCGGDWDKAYQEYLDKNDGYQSVTNSPPIDYSIYTYP